MWEHIPFTPPKRAPNSNVHSVKSRLIHSVLFCASRPPFSDGQLAESEPSTMATQNGLMSVLMVTLAGCLVHGEHPLVPTLRENLQEIADAGAAKYGCPPPLHVDRRTSRSTACMSCTHKCTSTFPLLCVSLSLDYQLALSTQHQIALQCIAFIERHRLNAIVHACN